MTADVQHLFLWDDSEVAQAQATDGGWQLRFSAAHVRQASPGQAEVDGHLTGVVLHCSGPLRPALDEVLGRVSHARLIDAQGRVWRELPLPTELSGPLRLELQAARGESLTWPLDTLRLSVAPDARFTESWAC